MKRNIYPRTVVSAVFELKTLGCTCSYKSNYQTITTM